MLHPGIFLSGIASLQILHLCTAVAQVCYEYDVPFTIIRIISDGSDESAEIDFPEFIREVSSKYAVGIIDNIFTLSASSVPR